MAGSGPKMKSTNPKPKNPRATAVDQIQTQVPERAKPVALTADSCLAP